MRPRQRAAHPPAFHAEASERGGGGAGLLRLGGGQGLPDAFGTVGAAAAGDPNLGRAARLGARSSERPALAGIALLADPYRPLERYARPYRPPRLRAPPCPLSRLRLDEALALLLRLRRPAAFVLVRPHGAGESAARERRVSRSATDVMQEVLVA